MSDGRVTKKNWPAAGDLIPGRRLSDSEASRLLERIEAFRMDDPKAQLPFTARLAREQGWTHAFAGRAVREYKRFVGLAAVAGHPVSPPEAVDQVWHLHLVYTKSYWQDLCRDVLGKELHHFPTSGGRAESDKFGDWYARTLESYRTWFGEEPPRDIWPEKNDAAPGRWIDPSRFWLLPRPAWWGRLFRKTFL